VAFLTRRRLLRQAAVAACLPVASPLAIRSEAVPPVAAAAGNGAQAIEDALALLARAGPEYRGGLANHGPMAASAIVAMGRPEAVVPWVEGYRRRLDDRPAGSRAIPIAGWRDALGDRRRVGDWLAFFGARVDEKPWREVVAEWTPRLAPGMIAAAFHGVIRTGHAVRSLAAAETPARRRELADGLAYWAASYTTFPERQGPPAPARLPSKALGEVPRVPEDRMVTSGFITSRLGPVQRLSSFATVAALADPGDADASAYLTDLTETFAGVFLASVPPGGLITFIHAVTGPCAVRHLLPHLPAEARRQALRYAWQGAAALYSGFGGVPPGPGSSGLEGAPRPPATRAEWEDLIDRSLASGDEHAIKLTEACRAESEIAARSVFASAARHGIERLTS
jgi:hypothetical protein